MQTMTTNAMTRRQLVAGLLVFSGFASGQDDISHAKESIHQEPAFQASRKRIYEALTDARQFDRIVRLSPDMQSGAALASKPTEISRLPGGAFSLFAGHIVGRQIELVANQRIVQAWR